VDVKDVQTVLPLAAYWDTLGWVHFRLNHFDLAEKYLLGAWRLTLEPDVADHLGQLYEKEGKKHEAAVAYSQALSALHPPDATRARLDALRPNRKYQAGEGPSPQALQDLRTIKLGKLATKHVSAEFFVLFAPGPRVVGVKFISGSEELRNAGRALAAAKFDVPFPGQGPVQILRRGVLDCEPVLPNCLFVLIPPGDVRSVN
jgi:tetratricopeptide (TPR) repeat protein